MGEGLELSEDWKIVCPNCFRTDLWMIFPHGGKATFTCFRCKFETPYDGVGGLEKIREWKRKDGDPSAEPHSDTEAPGPSD